MTAFVIDWIIAARRCAFRVRSLAQAVIFCLLLAPMMTAAFGAETQNAISLRARHAEMQATKNL